MTEAIGLNRRVRLRPAYCDTELQVLYPRPHDHQRWHDHHLRVNATIQLGNWMLGGGGAESGADLSCGNGSILHALNVSVRFFGDFAPTVEGSRTHQFVGPIERTLNELVPVDIFVLSETLEHLDDPDAVLRTLRGKTHQLLLSTPVDCWGDSNPEHYWAWSRLAVEAMLVSAGFTPYVYMAVDFRQSGLPYCFGIWGAQ